MEISNEKTGKGNQWKKNLILFIFWKIQNCQIPTIVKNKNKVIRGHLLILKIKLTHHYRHTCTKPSEEIYKQLYMHTFKTLAEISSLFT